MNSEHEQLRQRTVANGESYPAPVDADNASPFHPGERAVQARVGVREKIEKFGRRGIRNLMPEQHREFFAQLPLFIMGWLDEHARPWASALAGNPGFLSTPDPRHLHVAVTPFPGDPMAGNLREGMPIGGLGIEFHSRRRNRVNGQLTLDSDGGGFTIRVAQSFGNCAQYIQARRLHSIAGLERRSEEHQVVRLHHIDETARKLIARADTFFIASHYGGNPAQPEHGVDVSHRGGMPGFVRIDDQRSLVFPDYRGNFFFNTLGNLALNPRCGLLFIDFESGGTLQLTGVAEIQWNVPRNDPDLRGAQRLIRMRVDQTVYLVRAIPFGWDFIEYAPQLGRHEF